MRIAIGVFVLLLAARLVGGQPNCANFSGRYIIQGEDGKVRLWIRQQGCERIVIDRQSNYMATMSTERHDLTLDGVYHDTAPWLGARGKWEAAARIVPEGLETLFRRAAHRGRANDPWKTLYTLLPDGNLSVSDSDPGTRTYGTALLAERQPLPHGDATAHVQRWPYIQPVTSQQVANVCFSAKDLVDWSARAYAAFGVASVLGPDTTTLRRGYVAETRTATRRYSDSVPRSLSASTWLLLNEDGISPIRFTVLEGTIEYHVDSAMNVLGYPVDAGQACGRITGRMTQGAFVLRAQSSTEIRNWSTASVRIDTTGPRRYTLRIGDTAYVVDQPSEVFKGPKKALLFRGRAYSLLMVVWGAEPCENQYSLFEPRNGALFRVGLSLYNCDI